MGCKARLRLWGAAALVLLLGAAQAQPSSKGLRFGPPPAWVEVQAAPLEAPLPAEGLSQGQHYLLADEQVRVAGSNEERYRHFASRAVNERGVEQIASVQMRFDPSYQRLVIHSIDVRRNGQIVARLQPAAVKLLQREASMESLIFDGRLTAQVTLSDVRVGDVVDYAYSLQGRNPVFGAEQFGSFELQWDVSVARVHNRLLWPKGRALHWQAHNGAPPAQISERGGELDHRWQADGVAARVLDGQSPGWFDPYRWIEWGEFADWNAVARWAAPLYRLPMPMPGVEREIARIAASTSDPEQRLLAALRFVQREVRYLGIEIGANSHAPHAPELVLKRRFGDCKDKTLLSLALLRGLGISAQAALVHTTARQGTAERLPTPWAFNHVLVRAELGGQAYWLDPTRAPQAGAGLAQWVQADFGRALVVDPSTPALAEMVGVQARAVKREIHALLDASAGFDQAAQLTVTTRARGEAAETLRETLANSARDLLQKQYLDYYAASYAGLTIAAPLAVRDNPAANEIEVVERYRLPSYWKRDDKRARWNAAMEVPDLREWLRNPKSVNRQDPLTLNHPVEFKLISEFRLPGQWQIKPEAVHINDPAFELRREESWQGNTLTLTDSYRSRADHVPAAEVSRYVANLAKARTGVDYSLHYTETPPAPAGRNGSAPHWTPLLWGLLSLVALALLARRLYLWDPAPAAADDDAGPVGLGGWLCLPLLGLIATPFLIGKALLEGWPALTQAGWAGLTTRGAAGYDALFAPSLMLGLSFNLALLLGALLLLRLMLGRRSSLPRLYIGWLLVACAGTGLDALAFQLIPSLTSAWTSKNSADAARTLIATLIWTAYFLRSKRVQTTFVRRLPSPRSSHAPSTGLPAPAVLP